MTDTFIIPVPDLSVIDYADKVAHKNHRTVREWLAKGLLRRAYQDGSGKWWIPADDAPVRDAVAPRVESTPRSGVTTDLDIRESIAVPSFIPLYMPLADAAPLLGVTPYQLTHHQEEFGVVPWGEGGALVVPVRRLLGMAPEIRRPELPAEAEG